MTKELKEIRERLEKAHQEICGLANGKRKWTMCVPPEPDDSDMVLQAPLDDIAHLLKLTEKLITQRNRWIEQSMTDQSPLDVEAYIEQENEELKKVLREGK